jgi:WD40 repeat protein
MVSFLIFFFTRHSIVITSYILHHQLMLFPRFSIIEDETAPKAGDLYIRSVRFSPDGKLLATGAEDRKIRVSNPQSSLVQNPLHNGKM